MKYRPPLNGDTANPDRPWPNADPASGVKGARIDGPAIEYVQRELVALIEGAGLEPSDADLTQVYQAVNVLIASGLSGRIANMFQAGPTSPVSMQVQLAAGHVFTDGTLTEVATQTTAALVAPAAPNSRVDRIVIDRATGVLSVVAGAPAVGPVAPAIPSGKQPVARVLLTPTTVSITSANIADERDLFALGLGLAAFKALGADIVGDGSGNLTRALTQVNHTANFGFVAADRVKSHRFGVAAITATLLAAATAGDGWHCQLQDVLGGGTITSPATNIYVNGAASAVSSYTFVAGESGILLTNGASYFLTTNKPPSQLTSGFYSSAVDYGTITGGTLTPTYVGGNFGTGIANGAFTLAAPTVAGNFTLILELTNGAAAGAVTASGYATADLSALTTTAGDKFRYYIVKLNGSSTVRAEAMQ